MLRRRPKKTAGRYRLYCNLGYNLSEEVVRRYFQQVCTHGQILDVYIPRHNSGRNKGYGFTTFESEADLLLALQATEHIIGGNVVKINRAGPRPDYEGNEGEQGGMDPIHSLAQQTARMQLLQQEPRGHQVSAHGKGPRLYVGGIPDDVDANLIKFHFSRWGNVVDIYFPGKSGLKRVNYCFVTFDNWQAAQRSCNQSERCIVGRPIQSISLAEERTVDGRESSFAEDATRAGYPDASVEWLQQIRGLQQNNMGAMGMGDQHGQSYLRLPGPDGRMAGALGAMGGDPQMSREQFLYGKGPGMAAPHYGHQAQYWPNYQQPYYHPPQGSASPANLQGVNQYGGLLRNSAPGLNPMGFGELEALQQAVALNQGYSQEERPLDIPVQQHWRPDMVDDPFAGRGPQRVPDNYREWQPLASAQQRPPADMLAGQDYQRVQPRGAHAPRTPPQPHPGDGPQPAFPAMLSPASDLHPNTLGKGPPVQDPLAGVAPPESAAASRVLPADAAQPPTTAPIPGAAKFY